FALRRGVTSATRLVDLERHQPIAVLEGRTAEPLAKWLQAHPSVTVLARDRADASARAGRQAAPAALQVADRFHLLRHVGGALKTLLHARRWRSPTPATPPEGEPRGALANDRTWPSKSPQPTPRKRALWEALQPYRDLGQSCRQSAQAVGLERRTVRRYVAADQPPVYPARRPRPTQLTPHLGSLAERDVGAFAPWLHEAETSDVPAFRSLARSFRQDTEATLAALTTPWSTGQCEGQICRVKLLKRLGYGRAQLDLLRQRILHRMPVPVLPVQRDHEVERPVAA
ncbi:MAG: ISL3 family transposase, partial [Candidatus Entotheonellia bacterium]